MALVVVFTTMSFTISMHYCEDSLVDFSVFTKSESCGMENAQPTRTSEKPVMAEKKCCTDQQIVKTGTDELKTSFDQLTIDQQTFVASFFYSYINLFEGLDKAIVPFKDYSPPFIKRDIQTLFATYLI